MRAFLVVMATPVFNQLPGLVQVSERVLVEQVVAKSGIEALHEGILRGLSRLNEMQGCTAAGAPEKHRLAGQFRPVVAHQGIG